jgi:GNAT superfamily N-acetyltransferase
LNAVGGAPVRIHVAHIPAKFFSEIREVFVMPPFRNQGIGGFLEGYACKESRDAGSGTMRLLMHEADSVVGPPRAAARTFGNHHGYEWRWRSTEGPRIAAVGVKKLV